MQGEASGAGGPGLSGVVPFRFACHRCGHCCSGGSGHVWLADGEDERLAAALGATVEAFRARYVRTVPDPETGVLRDSLVEEGGRCALLAGADHCTVYDARPEHCRTFPFWPRVLADRAAFERARAVCPGIAVVVDPSRRSTAFRRLAALYAAVDAEVAALRPTCVVSGRCCRFEEAGHELFATALEADYAAASHPEAPPPEAEGRCPYHVRGLCTAREGRPLACRTYFCDPRTSEALATVHERRLAEVRAIASDTGYPAAYGRFPALLEARGIGGEAAGKDGGPPSSDAGAP